MIQDDVETRAGLIGRPRLIDLINLPDQAPVTTIVAGAGFGKTTLAMQWARQARFPVRWCALTPGDDDPRRLLVRIISTLDDTGFLPEPLLEVDQLECQAIALIDAFGRSREQCGLVVDDLQLITQPACHALLDRLVLRLPEAMPIVLISRAGLPLRLGRLRALGKVREIDADHLRFSRAEVFDAIEAERFHELSADQIVQLATISEGWIAGIRLASLSLRHGQQLERIGAHRGREHERFLDEYVREEIIAPLDPALQRFLREIAELPLLSAELCDAALQQTTSAELLDALQRECAFLCSSAKQSLPWRLHAMVGASLRRIASETESTAEREARSRRAAEWLVSHGFLSEAAELALGSDDHEWMAGIVEPWCRHLAERSDFERLSDWLDRLPAPLFSIEPSFGYWSVVAHLGIGQIHGARDALIARPGQWTAIETPLFAGRVALCQGMLEFHLGKDDPAIERLRFALATLPEEGVVERLYAATVIGRTNARRGVDDHDIIGAAESYAMRLTTDEQWAWRTLGSDRANTYALRGELSSAITKYRMMLLELPPALEELEGFLRCRLIDLHLERNELELAAQEYETVELLIGDRFRAWHHDALLAKAKLLLASGQRDAAELWATRQVRVMRRRPGKNQLILFLARIWLERGDYAMVSHWLRDVSAVRYPWIQTFGEINYRSLAIDLDLAQGRYAQAAATAEAIADEASASGRVAESIAFSTRAAIGHHLSGNRAVATRRMRAAIDAGALGGFVRSFDVAGFDVVELFDDLLRSSKPLWLALQRLHEGDGDRGASPLTKREVEVLRYVSMGRSNQQIADTLFISANTVRNHLVNICRRLHASSRSEAVAIAREMAILD